METIYMVNGSDAMSPTPLAGSTSRIEFLRESGAGAFGPGHACRGGGDAVGGPPALERLSEKP